MVLISASLLVGFVSAQTWNRRAYYNEAKCGGQFSYGVQVYTPNVPCISTPGVTLAQVCEIKSTNPLAPSAEATGCESTSPSSVTDSVWFPSGTDGSVIPNTNYLTLIKYNDASCSVSNGRINIEHETFAANGKCYAWEPNYYFKASCSGNTGSIVYCKDASCNDCNSTINFTNSCNIYNNLNTKMICTGANAAAGVSGGTGTTASPSGSPAPSARASGSPAPTASAKTNDAVSQMTLSSTLKTLLSVTGLAGLFFL